MLQLFTLALCAFMPILGWFYFFRNDLPRQQKYIILTFIAGMLSVVPIKLYEKYWHVAVLNLEHLNIFKSLADLANMQSLPSLFAYTLTSVIVMMGIFLFVAVMMFLLEVGTGDNSVKVFEQKLYKVFETPWFFVSVAVICGLLAYAMTLSLSEKIWFFVMVGILEEFVKHLVLRFSDEYKIHSVSEAIQFSIIVALGFAFVENVLYFTQVLQTGLLVGPQFLILIVLRSILSVGAHVSFSAILGYYYGLAKFSHEIWQQQELCARYGWLERVHRKMGVQCETLFHDQKMMEGVVLAMTAHALFNGLLEFNQIMWVFPYILVLLLWVTHLLHQTELHRYFGNLRAPAAFG